LGELLFLDRVAKSLSWITAAQSWLGPNSEEHDFVLPSADVEVKSTTREQRIHHITSLTQLQPKHRRGLQFVSVQLTPAASNNNAFSLATMVANVIASAGKVSATAAELIRDQIRSQGWEDEDAPYYETLYYLRGPLVTVTVAGRFPAIIPETLVSLGEAASRVDHVSYLINVDGLGVSDGTRPFDRVLFRKR
jgi:hypothetical protein